MAADRPSDNEPPYVWNGTIQLGDLPRNPSTAQADEVMRVVSEHCGQLWYAVKLSGWWRILCKEAGVGGARPMDSALGTSPALSVKPPACPSCGTFHGLPRINPHGRPQHLPTRRARPQSGDLNRGWPTSRRTRNRFHLGMDVLVGRGCRSQPG
jgi:hypothetical protein